MADGGSGGGYGGGPPASAINETAYLPSNGNPSEIILPEYASTAGLKYRHIAPLIRLHITSDLRDLITRSRQLIFAVKAPAIKFGSRTRITLLGDDRNLDHLMAYHMNSRDLSGDFGEKTDKSPQLTRDFLLGPDVVQARAVASSKIASIESRWKELVLEPLEQQYAAWQEGSGGKGLGLFKTKSGNGGAAKANYKDLAQRAGDLMREAKQVHADLEVKLLEAADKFTEQLPEYYQPDEQSASRMLTAEKPQGTAVYM